MSKVTPPPTRPTTVVRDRLVRAVSTAMERPLTVLIAPAGYGKTTALATALEVSDVPVAWVTLDATDNDPARLLGCVVDALQRAFGAGASAPARALAAGEDLEDVVVPAIAEALHDGGGAHVALVLDDLHAITDPEARALVARLVDHLPDTVATVIASRSRPALRLARRVVAGTATVIGPDVLAFRGAEAELLLNGGLGLGLAARELAAVESSAEGWAAGLVLTAQELADRGARAAAVRALPDPNDHVRAYLAEEVLDDLAPTMLRFLRRTSVLPRLNGALCEAVTGDPRARELFAEAFARSLFLARTASGEGWLRYHPQVARLLQDELDRTEPGARAALHARAATWFEDAGRYREALEHASRAGDGPRAGRLVLQVESELLGTGQYTVLRRVLDGLPGGLGEYEPLCVGLHAQSRLLEGADPASLEPVWRSLGRHRDAPGVARLMDHALIWPFYGQVSRSVAAGRRAYAAYRDESPELWHSMAAMLGFALCFDGRVPEARGLLERHLDEIAPSRSRTWALSALSFCLAKDGEPDAAVDRGREAVAHVESAGGPTPVVCAVAHQALAHALNGQGDQRAAAETIEQAFRTTAPLPGSLYHGLTLAIRAKIRLAQRDRAAARADLVQARVIVDRFPDAAAFSATVAALETEAGQRGVAVSPGSVPTPAELRLLELLPSDAPLPALADQLHISRNTMKTHARRLYRRLGVQTRADAVRVARDRGFL